MYLADKGRKLSGIYNLPVCILFPYIFLKRNSLILFVAHLLLQQLSADHMLSRLNRIPIQNDAITNKQINIKKFLQYSVEF